MENPNDKQRRQPNEEHMAWSIPKNRFFTLFPLNKPPVDIYTQGMLCVEAVHACLLRMHGLRRHKEAATIPRLLLTE